MSNDYVNEKTDVLRRTRMRVRVRVDARSGGAPPLKVQQSLYTKAQRHFLRPDVKRAEYVSYPS